MWQSQCTHRYLNLRQPSRLCTHNMRPEIWTRNMEGFQFLDVGGNMSAWRKPTKVGMKQPLASCIGERKVFLQALNNPSHHWSNVPSWYRTEHRPKKPPGPTGNWTRDLLQELYQRTTLLLNSQYGKNCMLTKEKGDSISLLCFSPEVKCSIYL